VYRLDSERALIFTLDFFPPVVDEPADYGAIAATNALNDVFAMGGLPLLALSIAAFPEELPIEMLAEVFAAAGAQGRAAGARRIGPTAVRGLAGAGRVGQAHGVPHRSGVQIRLESERFPAIDGALDIARKGVRTSGDPRNRDFASAHVKSDGISEVLGALGYDP